MRECVLFRVGPPDPAHPHLDVTDLEHLATLWGVTPEQVADDLVADGTYIRPPENPAAMREPDLANPPVDAEFEDITEQAPRLALAPGGA